MPAVEQFGTLPVGSCSIDGIRAECDDSRFLISGQPFEGRDIIYVHGLALNHIENRIGGYTPAFKLWPQDSSEFMDTGKYFRTFAEDYWRDHIRENLGLQDPMNSVVGGWQAPGGSTPAATPSYVPKSNRYMIAAWSSNQTIEYGQHALLMQIARAITNNQNVVTPTAYSKRFVRPFCSNGCVIVSHSAGALVTSSAMGLAKEGHFGDGGKQLASKIIAHVAFESALSGSRLATVGLAVGLGAVPVTGTANVLCIILDSLFNVTNTCGYNTSFLATSILRDLMPIVAQTAWGKWVNRSPVPTVMVAGGHPTGNYTGLTKIFLPGFDDGVVSMNSACGNSNPVFPGVNAPSGITVTSLRKAFDMGIPFQHAAANWLGHRNLVGGLRPLGLYLAGACTPDLSPTGMVMPVANAFGSSIWSARKRYDNHFSFIQGPIDHSYDGGTDDSNKWPSEMGQSATTARRYRPFFGNGNINEESRVVTNSAIYQTIDGHGTSLTKPLDMRVVVRGKKIGFHMPWKLHPGCVRPEPKKKPFKWYCTSWIWKRTYHLAAGWKTKQSSHYVYEYVARR